MAHSQNNAATTLDLHGRRMEEAISDVTLFLERIRRAAAAHSQGMGGGGGGGRDSFFVKIITGAGSHSTHGPVLRSAVEKLLIKRGMTFKLERGGGAYNVDALSGVDLYDPGQATSSKVLTAEEEEFRHMAFAMRKGNGNNTGNFASAAGVAQCTARSRPTRTASARAYQQPFRRSSSGPEPLPMQVASEERELKKAVRASVTENQKRRHRHERETKEFERDFHRAITESNIVQEASKRNEIEEGESLKLAFEQSLNEEQRRRQLTEKQYEEELMLALEQSTQESSANNNTNPTEEELIQQALAESRALAEAEKANHDADEDDMLRKVMAESLIEAIEEKNQRISFHQKQDLVATKLIEKHPSDEYDQKITTSEYDDDDLLQRALAESMATAEAEKVAANAIKDDSLEKALAESLSLLEEERKPAHHHHQDKEEVKEMEKTESTGIDLLGEVMRLSKQQQQQQEEEETKYYEEDAIKKAIEESKKNVHHGDVD